MADELLEGLDHDQLVAVTTEHNPLCILAGAGSGKTRVLTRRIAYRAAQGNLELPHVVALTFTDRAATELRDRLSGFGWRERPVTGTFHAIAYAQLRSWWSGQNRSAPALLDRKTRLISRLLPVRFPLRPRTVATEIDWAQARRISPDRYVDETVATQRRVGVDAERIAEIYREYRQEKRRRNVVDFDDLLADCTDALRDDADFARSQQWRFRHFFVDEYQDLNPLQHGLLGAWLGDRNDLCVVGDANQSIYHWNGADSRFLTGFTKAHPDAQVITLGTNHRSSTAVVELAAAILKSPPPRTALQRSDEPSGPTPTITACDDEQDEALVIARSLRAARRPGEPWHNQAVLVRTNAQAEILASTFAATGVPARVKGNNAFLDHPAVRDALAAARRASVPLQSWLADLEATVDASRTPDATADLSERILVLDSLTELGRRLLAEQPGCGTSTLPSWIVATVKADESAQSRADAVDIVSFHAAKGLEWQTVHIAGMEEGLVPSGQARTAEALAEERRLLYVALTRPARNVHLTWAKQRTFGSRTTKREPSRWMPLLAKVCDVSAAGARRSSEVTVRDSIATARAHLIESGGTGGETTRDRALAADLETWRRRIARAAKVPDAVILPDAVLRRIVIARPADLATLQDVPGLGIIKADRYGDEILALVGDPDGHP